MKYEMAILNSSTGFDVRLHCIFCGILFMQSRANSVKRQRIVDNFRLNRKSRNTTGEALVKAKYKQF
jgi:hypothetical protein